MQSLSLTELSAVIQTIILTISAAILYWQISELRKATAMDGFNTLAALLNSKESVDARSLLYHNKGKLDNLSLEDVTSIEKVLVLLDQLGCLVNKSLIPEGVAIEMYWDVVIKCWDSSAGKIKKERRRKRAAQRKVKRINSYKKSIKIPKPKSLFKLLKIHRLQVARKYSKATGFKLYPNLKPIAKDYPATHYENFEMLVYRCERYCKKRNLDRPVTF